MFTKTQLYLSALAVLFGAGAAHAVDGGSEFFYQAPADTNMITPRLGYASQSESQTSTGNHTFGSTTTSGLDLGANYERGFNDMWAAGLDLSWAAMSTSPHDSTDASPFGNTSGMNDIVLNGAGQSKMDAGNLHYGLLLDYSLGNAKAVTVPSTQFTSNQSGGMSLAPYVGWDMPAGPGWFGATLKYVYQMERTIAEETQNIKIDGGSQTMLSAFYEYTLAPDTPLGLKLTYDSVANGTLKETGQADQTLAMGSWLTVGLYSRIPVMEKQWLLVGFDYNTHSGGYYTDTTQANSMNPSSVNGWGLTAGYRMLF